MKNQPRAIIKTALICAGILGLSLSMSPETAAETTKERILREGTITIGIHNRSPWGYKDSSGNAVGFSPDIVRAALTPLGVKNIKFIISDFGALIPGLVANRFDSIASGLYINPKRCEVVAFSDPDLSLKDALIVAKGNPFSIHSYADIVANGKIKFGTTRGSANAKNAAAAGVPKDRISLFQNTESTVAALTSGRVDAISFSAPTAISLTQDSNIKGIERALPFKGLIKANGLEKSGYSAIAFRQSDSDLRDLYNKRLSEMKADGTVKKIMTKYGFTDAETAPNLTQADICDGKS